MNFVVWVWTLSMFSLTKAGISPVHDAKLKYVSTKTDDANRRWSSPHKVLQHLDNSVKKNTKSITQNPKMEESLFQISKDLVATIISKLDVQNKITQITKEALEATNKNNKGITAIENRRILDYLSRTLSTNILTITRSTADPEMHRLVYGLAQIATEISLISALNDVTFSTAMSKKQSIDLGIRRKRAAEINDQNNMDHIEPGNILHPTEIYNAILNKTSVTSPNKHTFKGLNTSTLKGPHSVLPESNKKPVHLVNAEAKPLKTKGFLNQTDFELKDSNENETSAIIVQNKISDDHEFISLSDDTLDNHDVSMPALVKEDMDNDLSNQSPLTPDIVAEMEIDHPEIEDLRNEKKMKHRMEKLEGRAKKAIMYAGDVAYLTAASIVSMRRALTASVEVQMSVKFAKNGMSNHHELMMNLARTAAQQAGKEAKSASSRSAACERVIKLALKYASQSAGAKLSHVANRIVMDTLSLGTLTKSVAYVSSEIAINSLYEASDTKLS